MAYEWVGDYVRQAREARRRGERPVDCPNDGTRLIEDQRTGNLVCPFDGYVWRNR